MSAVGYVVLGLFAVIAISAVIDMAWTLFDAARDSRPSRMRSVLFIRDLLSAVRRARAERELDELIDRRDLASEELAVLHAREVLALADRISPNERTAAAVSWARSVLGEEERRLEASERRLDAHRAARGVRKLRGAK